MHAANQGRREIVRFLVAEARARKEGLCTRVLDYESGQRLVSLTVDTPASVRAVQRLIKSVLGVPKKEQWLFCEGTRLQPCQSLVTEQERLTLHLRGITPACHSCRARQALRYCSRCLDTHYCSEDCQLDDWRGHRRTCAADIRE